MLRSNTFVARLSFGVLVVLLAGCAGSQSVTSSGSVPHRGAGQSDAAHFSLTIPNRSIATRGRVVRYISPSTLSGTVQVNGGAITEVDLAAASPLCTAISGGRACTVTVSAPAGLDTFKLVLYDGAFTAGSHTGTALSANASVFSATIVAGSSNVTIPLILGGIPASVDVGATAFTAGQPATNALVVTAYDQQNNIIVGPAKYADATGTAAPLTVALGIAPFATQVTLHNGAQNGTSVTIAGPSDAPTIQLSAPANVIGIPFIVTTGASATQLSAANAQRVAVSGTFTAVLLGVNVPFAADYTYYAPMRPSIAPGMPHGFAFSFGSQSGGGFIGLFNSATENVQTCTVSGFYRPIAAVTSGLAYAYGSDYNLSNPPFGLGFVGLASLNGSACPIAQYQTSAVVPGVARSLAFDRVANRLFEGDQDSNLRYDAFTGANFSGNTTIGSLSSNPVQLESDTLGRRFFILRTAGNAVYSQSGTSVPVALTAAGATFTSLTVGIDNKAYAVDGTSRRVSVDDGATLQPYSTGQFNYAPPATGSHLAIGPDGNAYTDINSSRFLQQLTPAGMGPSFSIPAAPGGSGHIDAVFDGGNGYLYLVLSDYVGSSTEYFIRVSY